jgi:hypothetical protein
MTQNAPKTAFLGMTLDFVDFAMRHCRVSEDRARPSRPKSCQSHAKVMRKSCGCRILVRGQVCVRLSLPMRSAYQLYHAQRR